MQYTFYDKSEKDFLPICLHPKTYTEEMLYKDMNQLFGNAPVVLGFFKFVTVALGINPYKFVSYNSFDNPIHLSHNSSDMSKNHHEVYLKVNRIFKEKSVDAAKTQRFSELYCALVTRLRDEAYVGNMQHDQKERLLNELLEKANELQKKLDDNLTLTPPINRMIYSRQQQQVMRELDKLLESYIFNTLENAKQNCAMIQCSSNNNCEDYDKEKLDFFTMEIKEQSGKIYRVPKINFEIDIEKLYSPDTYASYSETVNKVIHEEIDPQELIHVSNYFQSYKGKQIFDGKTQIKWKTLIAFKKVIKVPIKFGAWFDPKIYQISSKNTQEISLEEGSYRTYAEYCRMPKKIIIGANPVMITEAENFKYTQSKSEREALIILGYEVDNSLCKSPLIGSFGEYNSFDNE